MTSKPLKVTCARCVGYGRVFGLGSAFGATCLACEGKGHLVIPGVRPVVGPSAQPDTNDEHMVSCSCGLCVPRAIVGA